MLALASFGAGFIGALTGLGGGVVIVPLLVIAFGVDIRYAIGASLVSVIATSSGAAAAYVREGFQAEPATGYETLIYDWLIGDPTLFQRADNIEAGWAAVQPILDGWVAARGGLELYAAGGTGPAAADQFLARDGVRWLPPA